MGIDACIDVTFSNPLTYRDVNFISRWLTRDVPGVWLERTAHPGTLTIPTDLGRMHRPGQHIGAWELHKKVIMFFLAIEGVTDIRYYGDSGNVAPVFMTYKKVLEYDQSYKEMMEAL